jgi:hypothetical protein
VDAVLGKWDRVSHLVGPGPDLYVDSLGPQYSNEPLIGIVAGIDICGMAGANQDRKQDEQAQSKGPEPMVSMSLENSWHFLGRTTSDW